MKKSRVVCVVAVAWMLATGQIWGQVVGRVQGKVVDENGDPLKGVKVTVTCPELESYQDDAETSKKGKFLISHVDGTKHYVYELTLEGYQSVIDQVKPVPGGMLTLEFEMPSLASLGATAASGTAAAPEPVGVATPAVRTYDRGVEAVQEGDLDLALERFLEAAEMDPTLVEAHASIAGVYLEKGMPAEAAAAAATALELRPSDLRALAARYQACKALGLEDEAQAALDAMSAAGEGDEAARRLYNEGVDELQAGRLAEAKGKFSSATLLDPSLPQPYLALAKVALDLGSRAEAAEAARRYLELQPGDARGIRLLYQAVSLGSDSEERLSAARAFAASEPELAAGMLMDDGTALFNSSRYPEAASLMEVALEIDPGLVRAHYVAGLCYVNTGQTTRAREHLERFVSEAGDDPDVPAAQEILGYLE